VANKCFLYFRFLFGSQQCVLCHFFRSHGIQTNPETKSSLTYTI
jgi:hypothetical protein